MEIGPAAVPALTAALSDPRPLVRAGAAAALGGADERNQSVPALLGLLGDEVAGVRLAAIEALVHRSPDAEDFVGLLILALADPNVLVRKAAVLALAGAGRNAESAIQPLMDLLRIGTDPIRVHVPEALAKIGGASGEVLEILFIVLEDGAADVRTAASKALRLLFFSRATLGGPDALLQALRQPQSQSAGVRAELWRVAAGAASGLLRGFGRRRADELKNEVVSALRNNDAAVRRGAAAALRQCEIGQRPPGAVEALELLAGSDPDPDVRAEAKKALDRMGR